MLFRGTLSIDDNLKESKLDGTLLATQGSADPFGDATTFLEDNGFSDGDDASITGTQGNVGAQPVIFMTGAQAAVAALAITEAALAIIPPVPLRPRPPVKKKKAAPVRKAPAKKAAPKKALAKKQTAAKKKAPKKNTSRSKR